MDLKAFLNVMLVLIGSAATLAAFGGETWDKEKKNESFAKRITNRGWISLALLGLALIVGVVKELWTSHVDALKNSASEKRDSDAVQRETALKAQLEDAKGSLTVLSGQLNDAKGSLAAANTKLGTLQQSVIDTQSALSVASGQLDRQGTINVVAGLANAEREVEVIYLIIPFTQHAERGPTYLDYLLPRFRSSYCRSESAVVIVVNYQKPELLYSVDSTSWYREGDKGGSIVSFNGDKRKEGKDAYLHFVHQSSWDGSLYLDRKQPHTPLFADQVFARFASHPNDSLTLSLSTPDDNQLLGDGRKYPRNCYTEAADYFVKAYEKAALIFVLKGKGTTGIIVHLRAGKPQQIDGRLGIKFLTEGPPVIEDVGFFGLIEALGKSVYFDPK